MANVLIGAASAAVRERPFRSGFYLGWIAAFTVNTAVVLLFF